MSTPIRNLAIVGHAGCGKTTLAEGITFAAGVTTRRGTIIEGNTLSDYHPDEISRKHSINTSLLSFTHDNIKLNLLDTPGYADFTGEVRSALHVADTALVMINASAGVEIGTDQVWDYSTFDQNSVIFIVNKLDVAGANYDTIIEELKSHFGHEAAVVQFPYNPGPGFNKIIDVMKMKMLTFKTDGSGLYTEEDIPADISEKADQLHKELVEIVAESDDTLMEEFFSNDGQLEESHFSGGIHESLAHRKLFPVLCCSSDQNIGVKRVLEFIVTNAPAPDDHLADVHGINPENKQDGEIDWEQSLGGSKNDEAYSVELTSDGGYIVAGFSYSDDGNVVDHHGSIDRADYWIIKLDQNGETKWRRSFGGTGEDEAFSIRQTSDKGYIIAGYSTSTDNDVSGNHGNEDYWIIKIDSASNLLWQKSLGGKKTDVAFALDLTKDGGCVVAGFSSSTDGDISGNHGDIDYWVVKLDAAGIPEWKKNYGGGDLDAAYSIKQIREGGYIIAGNAMSTDGQITGNHGGQDYWIVKTDNSGNLLWQKSLGGSDDDYALCIRETVDSGYIVVGSAISRDSNITNHYGLDDYWVVRLGAPAQNSVRYFNRSPTTNYPNPFSDKTTVVFSQPTMSNATLYLYNPLGQQVDQFIVPVGHQTIILERKGLTSGMYVYRLMSGGVMIETGNIIIQ